MNDPLVFKEGGCPLCGEDLLSEPDDHGKWIPGAPVYCAHGCGWHGRLEEDDEGIEAVVDSDIEGVMSFYARKIQDLREIIEEERQVKYAAEARIAARDREIASLASRVAESITHRRF